ncbi:Glucuronoarabinoxylan endo-1,4-beta-xylanase [Bacillus subtilis subsp. subtilis]|nr:Glucuronoarabinoxylan endo-1,4-beta-xylanase [Bacillus subtilis subsp. subtilis]
MIPRIKKTICVLLVCFTMLSVMLGPGATEVLAASDVTVNVSAEKQVIRGFGGMNHPAWAGGSYSSSKRNCFWQ